MIVAVPDTVSVDPGATLIEVFVVVAGVIVGVVVMLIALALLSTKLSPTFLGRWWRKLWVNNVTKPLTQWQSALIQSRIEWLMNHENGGSSLKDLSNTLKRLEGRFDSHISESTEDRAELHRQVAELLEHDADRDQAGKRYGGNAAEGGT